MNSLQHPGCWAGVTSQPPLGTAAICHEPDGSTTSATTGLSCAARRAPKNRAPCDALAVAAGDGDLDRQILVEKSAVAIEPVHVDDRRDDAPECLAAMAIVDEHREAGR